jgi:peptidase M23-like protein/Big-like domain-containing protein
LHHIPRTIRHLAPRGLPFAVQASLVAALAAGSVVIAVFGAISTRGVREASTVTPIEADGFRPIPMPAPTKPPTRGVDEPGRGRVVEAVHATPVPESPVPKSPKVVVFRPRDGWSGIGRRAAVSVRFTLPMDHLSTEQAFRAFIGSSPVAGSYRWADASTVLVLQPASALPYAATVGLSVDSTARSADGAPLVGARSVTFTVRVRPVSTVPGSPAPQPEPIANPPPTAWRWPLIGPITQGFGEYLTKYGFHQGIDIDGETGDPVRAARSGRVTVAGHYDACGGLEVHIDHGVGFESWYRHLSRIDVRTTTRIEVGTVIGAVGSTGCALGSHLHFAIRKDGVFVDPLRYLSPR